MFYTQCHTKRRLGLADVTQKEGLTGLVPAEPSIGMTTTMILRSVLVLHSSVVPRDQNSKRGGGFKPNAFKVIS